MLYKMSRRLRGTQLLLLLLLLVMLWSHGALSACAGSIRAFSLREADRLLEEGHKDSVELCNLGGITRLAGMVFDRETSDIILVGKAVPGCAPVSLDDFIVALRCRLLQDIFPLVSIDIVQETAETGEQKVRFQGGVEDTYFGKTLLDSDVVLKRYSLDLLKRIKGVDPYLKRCEADTTEQLRKEGHRVQKVRWLTEKESASAIADCQGKNVDKQRNARSRFWFHALESDSYIVELSDVYVIERLRIGVKAETLNSKKGRVAEKDGTSVADTFAAEFTERLQEVSEQHPDLKRLKTLFDMVAISEGIAGLKDARPQFEFLMKKHSVQVVATPRKYPLIQRLGVFERGDGGSTLIQLSGGVRLQAVLLALEDGDVSALRQAVCESRPGDRTLCWTLPLDDWEMPNLDGVNKTGKEIRAPDMAEGKGLGFALDVRILDLDKEPGKNPFHGFGALRAFPAGLAPKTNLVRRTRLSRDSGAVATDIGGVMLNGVAEISDANRDELNMGDGLFSLVANGVGRKVDPMTYRQFVTALWAVYYGSEPPGISIDPIAPGIEKHMVRYIGNVINTDLGRVMRDADYLMKKWAVGTDRPDVRGFQPVDALIAKYNKHFLGVSSRFWFVPDKMVFRQAGGALLFESGRMMVKTEHDLQQFGARSNPADEGFARFFTDKYEVIAEKYPVYQDLFKYAKFVTLASYLKESGVPLHWFLMAHKDLVLTEDSPGTVDALAKGSSYVKNMQIEGGVDLRNKGKYVIDRRAAAAIRKAMEGSIVSASGARQVSRADTARMPVGRRLSFKHARHDYTLLPQLSGDCGRDTRGTLYKTDLSIRKDGVPGLELVRFYDWRRPECGEFGKGWRLLVPYRVRAANTKMRKFCDVMIPDCMVVEDLLAGTEENLTFSTNRYSVAGYVPDRIEDSHVVGLFLTVGGTFRLADKLGNEFWFDGTGDLTDILMSENRRITYRYHDVALGRELFAEAPYRIVPADKRRTVFSGVRLPQSMRVTDITRGTSEVLAFDSTKSVIGYFPAGQSDSRYKILAILSDGSFVLLDRFGNKIQFDVEGVFVSFLSDSSWRVCRSVEHGTDAEIVFSYEVGPQGRLLIARAGLFSKEGDSRKQTCVVTYSYDPGGELLGVERGPGGAE